MPDQNASHDFDQRRARAESDRQTGIEKARRDYALASYAERAAYDATVQGAKARLAKAEQPLEFVPENYAVGTDSKVDKAFAELDAARAVVDALPGAPDHAELRAQMQTAIDAADAEFNRQLAAGFPEN